tara:strand:- start:3582 stop:4403 length:822 start_codon:yes stop_codon:yes gene_type:complete
MSYLPQELLYKASNDYDDGNLPVSNKSDLASLGSGLGSDLTTLSQVLDAVGNGTRNSGLDDAIEYNPVYYYKVLASVMTADFHEDLIGEDGLFKELRDAAFRKRMEVHRNLNEVQNSAQNATKNWTVNSDHLGKMYESLRKNRSHEYITIVDDNTTLLRQSQLNNDMRRRREYVNAYLKIVVIFLCLLILVGYMNHIEFGLDFVIPIILVLLVLFTITCLITWRNHKRMHDLAYLRLKFPGYPVKNEAIQKKYLGDCSTGNTDSREATCTGLQ